MDGVVIIALVESLKVERFHSFRRPKPQEIRHVGAISRDWNVIRDTSYYVLRYPAHTEMSMPIVIMLGMASDAHIM